MTNESTHQTHVSAVDDMIADLGVNDAEANQVRALLGEVAGLAHEVPEPSDDVRALLNGAVPLRPRRRTALVAAAVGALAFGGVSAAAAANRLPDRVQEIVADATDGVLPVDIPHPVKPVNPPYDAPGHIKNKPKAPKPSDSPKPDNTTAPGQIQKSTKPDPKAPGPARPADPGSHGRAHNPDKTNNGHAADKPADDSDDSDTDDNDKPDKVKSHKA